MQVFFFTWGLQIIENIAPLQSTKRGAYQFNLKIMEDETIDEEDTSEEEGE